MDDTSKATTTTAETKSEQKTEMASSTLPEIVKIMILLAVGAITFTMGNCLGYW